MTAAESTAQPMVKAELVCKNFGALKVLKGITLEVQRGQVLVLVGPSGSGKSTFLRCINHLETVNAGRLYVDGDLVGYNERGGRLYEMKPREVAKQRREVGMVFQHFNLFPHRTALGNVVDRVLYGYVLDFLNMSCCGITNPFVFNVADVFIQGLEAAGGELTAERFVSAMESVHTTRDFFGSPEYRFSATEHLGNRVGRLARITPHGPDACIDSGK